MFLTRVELPLAQRSVQRLLSNPYAMHQWIMSALPHPADRVLFRLEPLTVNARVGMILLQTKHEPKWPADGIPSGSRLTTKRIENAFQSLSDGQHLRFRMRANPTNKQKREGKDQGRRCPLIREEDQLKWLMRKGEQCGFQLLENPTGKIPACVIRDEKEILARKPTSAHPLTFRSVLFEGTLTVTDTEKFRQTLAAGIGSGKAFGFGLLSVARA